MTDEQKAKLDQLARIAGAKRDRYRNFQMTNYPTDEVRRREIDALVAIAETEWMEAEGHLRAAQRQVVIDAERHPDPLSLAQ